MIKNLITIYLKSLRYKIKMIKLSDSDSINQLFY